MSTALADPGVEMLGPVDWVRILLRGVGQVMFQGHAGTGLLFVIGVAVGGPSMAVGALVGTIVGTATAFLLRFDRGALADGIYGFNATLVGIALVFYLKPGPLTWGLIVVGSVVATLLTHVLRRIVKAPTYTAAFVVTTWVALTIAHASAGSTIDAKPAPPSATPGGFAAAVVDGVAEVMFGANAITGLLFLVGIGLSSWRLAAIALLGSVVGTAVATYHGDPSGSISIGIYGYNAALAAMAVFLWRASLLSPILGAIVSVPLTEFFPKSLGLPALTAPFVVASWTVLAVGALERRFVGSAA